jgi:sporulation protein YlmC with PRC-barrel domain
MRKLSIPFSLLVLLALLLTACQPAATDAELTATAQAEQMTPLPPVEETPLPPVEETPPAPVEPTPVEPTPVEPTPAEPEDTPEPEVTPEPEDAMQLRDESRVSAILGAPIEDQQGENIGTVDELLVDRESGQIIYAVVGYGGFLGIGQRDIMVPWTALNPVPEVAEDADRDRLYFVSNIDEETLANAPEIDLDEVLEARTPDWDAEQRAYWDQHTETLPLTGEPEMMAAPVRIRGGAVTGVDFDVLNPQGEDIGDVEEMIVDQNMQHIQYAVVDFDDAYLTTDEQQDRVGTLVPVPWEAFDWQAHLQQPEEDRLFEDNDLVLTVDPQQLIQAPRFELLEQFPDATTPDWDAEIRQFWADLTQQPTQ